MKTAEVFVSRGSESLLAVLFGSFAVAILVAASGCGDSQSSSAPTKSEAPAATSAPSAAAAPTKTAAPAPGISADLTFSGAINGHGTDTRAASTTIFATPCTPGAVRVGVTVDGHGYTISAASFGDQARPEEVYIGGEDVRANYQGTRGKVTFTNPRSVVFDVDLAGRGNTEGQVHLSGTASC